MQWALAGPGTGRQDANTPGACGWYCAWGHGLATILLAKVELAQVPSHMLNAHMSLWSWGAAHAVPTTGS